MNEDLMEKYLEHTGLGSDCENCGEPMKILHFQWGDTETHSGLITVLNTILEEDEMLEEPFPYEKLEIEYCKNCQAVNLSMT